MIDLHCHILPGIDDGAVDLKESIRMAKQANAEGIHTIVATPHHQNGRYNNNKENIKKYVQDLKEALAKERVNINILPGQESRIFGEMVEEYKKGSLLTINDTDKYLFVEFPSSQVPRYTEQLFYNLQAQGLTPIIVHPERNKMIIEKPDLLYDLVNRGAMAQLTASSLTGVFGKKIQKFSNQLIYSNLVHFIASDAHNLTSRTFGMEQVFYKIVKEYGMDTVCLFNENAQAVVDGKPCFKEVPEKIRPKKFLKIF
jgi:protein-tyrosine phosphatase